MSIRYYVGVPPTKEHPSLDALAAGRTRPAPATEDSQTVLVLVGP